MRVLLPALVRSPVDALDVLPQRGAVGVALLAAGEGAHVRPVVGLNLEFFLFIIFFSILPWLGAHREAIDVGVLSLPQRLHPPLLHAISDQGWFL